MAAVKMQLPGAYICITVCILWSLSFSSAIDSTTKSPTTAVHIVPKLANNTNNFNDSHNANVTNHKHLPSLNDDSSMIQRALYVLIGITIIGVFYFLIRAVRLKKTTQRKYGLVSNQEDNMEKAHLESDEEDMTVYEAKALRR